MVKEWVKEWIKEWVKELVKELVKEWGSGALMEVGKDCAKDCVYIHGFCDVDKVFAYIHVFLARGIRWIAYVCFYALSYTTRIC